MTWQDRRSIWWANVKPQMQIRFSRFWATGIWHDYGIHKKELQRRWADKLPIAGDVCAWIDFHITNAIRARHEDLII